MVGLSATLQQIDTKKHACFCPRIWLLAVVSQVLEMDDAYRKVGLDHREMFCGEICLRMPKREKGCGVRVLLQSREAARRYERWKPT